MEHEPNEERPRRRGWRDPRFLAGAGALGLALLLTAVIVVVGSGDGTPDVMAATDRGAPSTTEVPTTTSPSPTTSSTVATTSTTEAPPPPTTEPPATTSAPVPPPPPTTVQPAPAAAPPDVAGTGALCVGDSIMLGASPRYYDVLSMCGTVDAEVGRQMSAGAGVVASHAPFPPTVVVHLGTNGATNAGEIDAVLGRLTGVGRVVLVTVQLNGTRSWESSVNAELHRAAHRWGNVRIADWYAASAGHGEYFSDDRIHLSSAGARAYAATIAAALQ